MNTIIVTVFAVLVYMWLRGQIHYGLRYRLLSSLVFVIFTAIATLGIHNTYEFYYKKSLAIAFRNMIGDKDADQQADYQRMIEHYMADNAAGALYLEKETARLKKKYAKSIPVEEHRDK